MIREPDEAQHLRGRLTARERIALLCDQDTFEELLDGSGDASVVVGSGAVHGREVFIFAKDQTFMAGSMSAAHAKQINDIQTRALAAKAPLIGLFDSSGLRLDDDLSPMQGYDTIIQALLKAQGVFPQIALIMGPSIGADAFAARLMDVLFMVKETSALVVTGPEIANQFSDEPLTLESLGGTKLHAESGLASGVFDDDIVALAQVRRFIDFLPGRSWKSYDVEERHEASLATLIPDGPEGSYDVKELISKVLDEGDFFELSDAFAGNLITGFGRLDGGGVGIIANQPCVLGGVLDFAALVKAEAFVTLCQKLHLPLLTFVDAPGFLPGLDQERAGIAAAGAKLMSAYAKFEGPKVTLITGQAFGAAFTMMGSKQLCGSVSLAWPNAHIGMMKADGARFSAREAQTQGMIDRVVTPRETREHLRAGLYFLTRNGWFK